MPWMQARGDDNPSVGIKLPTTEYLAFTLGSEHYAIDILHVREIRSHTTPTPIVNSPPFIPGVINLRGSIVPLLDLRLRFGSPSADITPFTVSIIVNVANHLVGMIVDGLSDVIQLHPDEIRPAPELASTPGETSIQGLCLVGERMVIVLDIERLVTSAAAAMKS